MELHAVLEQLRLVIDPRFRKSDISVYWDAATDLFWVWAEEPVLLQIFLNLAQNSHKVLSSSDRKQLTISAGGKGDQVLARFHDTGPGVARRKSCFVPFSAAPA